MQRMSNPKPPFDGSERAPARVPYGISPFGSPEACCSPLCRSIDGRRRASFCRGAAVGIKSERWKIHRSSRGVWSTSPTSTICEQFPAGIQVTGGSTCVRNLHRCRRHDIDTLDVPLGPTKDFLEQPASKLDHQLARNCVVGHVRRRNVPRTVMREQEC